MTTTATEHVPAGTVLQVDPNTLVLDENIRTDVQLGDAFVESIRTHGVRVPLDVRVDPLGQLLIVDGQLRWLAALQTARATVPVLPTDGIGDDEARITEQWIINEHRAQLTEAEKASAVKQLSLFGRSPAAIEKKLGASREDVDAALVVAEAPQMLQALAAEPELDLVTAAKLAEFADDAEVLEELTACALEDPGDLEHNMQLHRQDRAVAKAQADRKAQLAQAGVRLVAYGEGRSLGGLAAVSNEHGSMAPVLTSEQHADCPHRAVAVTAHWAAGAPVVQENEVCMDPEAAGHHFRFRSPQSGSSEDAGEVDEEALAAEKSAQIIHVRKQNAASDAAQEVRRRFIIDQLLWERDPKGRMAKVPDGAVQHIASVIEANAAAVSGYETGNLLSEWTKGKTTPPPGSSRAAAERALLRRVLAAGEAILPRDFWRQVPKPYYYDRSAPVTVQHLRQLEAWGYGLAPIEREYLAAWDAAVTKQDQAKAELAAARVARESTEAEA